MAGAYGLDDFSWQDSTSHEDESMASEYGWDVSWQQHHVEKKRKKPQQQCGFENLFWWNQVSEASTKRQQTTDETQSFISDALKSMSLQDRDKVYHEVHGVEEPVKETQELLVESFRKLKEALGIARKHRPLDETRRFRLAEQMDYNYVHSTFFYKAFLRAERFDANRAAERMIRYYAMKGDRFGDHNLCQDLTQEMLSPAEVKCMKNGFNQLLPWRDRSGRCLFLVLPHLADYDSSEMLGRVYLYLQFKYLQDEETQKKGVTCIVFDEGDYERQSKLCPSALPVGYQTMLDGPIRYTAMHHCYSDDRFKSLLLPALKVFLRELRARNKLHFGTHLECMYSLGTFGIPRFALPFNSQGEATLKQNHHFIDSLAVQEKMINTGQLRSASEMGRANYCPLGGAGGDEENMATVIVIPKCTDILLGRGTRVNTHQGNVALHRMVENALLQYCGGARADKTDLTKNIVDEVKKRGGRFIKRDSNGVWLVVDNESARLKVSHLFRARKDALLKKNVNNDRGGAQSVASDGATKRFRSSSHDSNPSSIARRDGRH